ncbi:unnamed protein product [Rhodiola kirilowii]
MGDMAQMARFPGFRFCPTDVELISYYLKQNTTSFALNRNFHALFCSK